MGYIVGKELNKYFTEKYGKNFERATKRYEIVYIVHYILCIVITFTAFRMKIPLGLLFLFGGEMLIILPFMLHPSFNTVSTLLLPSMGMVINIITYFIVRQISISSQLDLEVNSVSNIISAFINLIINTFIIFKVIRDNKMLNLTLKVLDKQPLDYGDFVILFEDSNGQKYFFDTDLDEKFNIQETYSIKLKNKNISRKSTNINGKEYLELEGIDASYFNNC